MRPLNYTRTTPGLTVTTEGDIAHKWVTIADGTRIQAPVRVGKPILRNGDYRWVPWRDAAGQLQFVLPGGREFAA